MRVPNEDDVLSVKEAVREKFKLVDDGNMKHFLGMEIQCEGDTRMISVNHRN